MGHGARRVLTQINENGTCWCPAPLRRKKIKPRHEDGAHGPATLFFSSVYFFFFRFAQKEPANEGGQSGGGTDASYLIGLAPPTFANRCQSSVKDLRGPAIRCVVGGGGFEPPTNGLKGVGSGNAL